MLFIKSHIHLIKQSVCVCFLIAALTSQLSAAEYFSNYAEFCKQLKGQACLNKILNKRKQTPIKSMMWYQLTGYYFDYLYRHVVLDTLLEKSSHLLIQKDHPKHFLAQLYFYQAKSLLYYKRKDEAHMYADKAYKILNDISVAFPDPLRLIEIANLKHVFGDSKQAYAMLQRLHKTYQARQDPQFHFELQGNMAQALQRMGHLESAVKHYEQSAKWAIKTKIPEHIAIATGNLGRTYQMLERNQEALFVYEFAVEHLLKTQNKKLLAAYYLRLSEVSQELQLAKKGADYFAKIDTEQLSKHHFENYQALVSTYKGQ